MNHDILIRVDHISKKFCKDLKRSLWYGLKDVALSLKGNVEHRNRLRKDEFWAVKDVSFELRRGECLGLIGHNGAGKSTLLKMLNGLITPDQGTITMKGRVGALIELGAGFNPILTGRENVYNNGAVLGFTKEEIDRKFDAIVDFAEIGEFIDTPVQNYSSGMKVRLGFAVAAQMEPDILLIDEVLAVGDMGFQFKSLNAMSEIMKKSAVIFVSHTMQQIYRVCSEVMLLNHGSAIFHGNQIGRGVEMYLSRFARQGAQVAGSGEAVVKDFSMNSKGLRENGLGTITLPYGADLGLDVEIELDPSVPEALVQIVVWNQQMLPVMDIVGTGLEGYYFKRNATGRHKFHVDIPRITLNYGNHYFSVIIISPDAGKVYCRHDNAGVIQVIADTMSGAHHLYEADWIETTKL